MPRQTSSGRPSTINDTARKRESCTSSLRASRKGAVPFALDEPSACSCRPCANDAGREAIVIEGDGNFETGRPTPYAKALLMTTSHSSAASDAGCRVTRGVRPDSDQLALYQLGRHLGARQRDRSQSCNRACRLPVHQRIAYSQHAEGTCARAPIEIACRNVDRLRGCEPDPLAAADIAQFSRLAKARLTAGSWRAPSLSAIRLTACGSSGRSGVATSRSDARPSPSARCRNWRASPRFRWS